VDVTLEELSTEHQLQLKEAVDQYQQKWCAIPQV
jgi:hypothetical protein